MTENNLAGAEAQDDAALAQQPELDAQTTGAEIEANPVDTQVEASAESAPEGEAPQDPPRPKVEKVPDHIQKAFDRIAFEKREAERRARQAEEDAAALRALLEKSGREQPAAAQDATAAQPRATQPANQDYVPRAELDRLAREQAQKIAAEKAFNDACDETYNQGKKDFDDFDAALGNLRMVNGLSNPVIEAALATGSAHKVLYEIGRNPAEAERILNLPPLKMAVEFGRLASSAPPAKPVSRTPAPVRPVESGGGSRVSGDPRDDDDEDTWFAKREAQRRARLGR